MIGRLLFLSFFIGALILGFGLGSGKFPPEKKETPKTLSNIHPEREVTPSEYKSFAIVLSGHNDAFWCERTLRSIFEQEYDYFRLIFIDDGSEDGTFEKVQNFVVENRQEHRVILMKNGEQLGPVACLYRALEQCLDREIVLPLSLHNWLAQPNVLSRLNRAFQNPDVWVSFGTSLQYPSYELVDSTLHCFYGALFKQLSLSDLFEGTAFTQHPAAYLTPILELSGGRVKEIQEPLSFSNQTLLKPSPSLPPARPIREPLAQFPTPRKEEPKTDVVIFSFDRPLQLYATLESIQRYLTGYAKLSILYRASDERFAAAYQKLQATFPQVQFVRQGEKPRKDFKPLLLKILFNSPSKYILFGVDDALLKDYVDLHLCRDMMEKTGAYGFYLRFGHHIRHCYQAGSPQEVPPSVPLGGNILAWDIRSAALDWGFANNLDMTLYRKEDLRKQFQDLKYKQPTSLEFGWAQHPPSQAIGLYFTNSKMLNIPLNILAPTGNPHMNFLSPEELLVKFNQGLKMDIDPLFQIENSSPHHEYIPDFVRR
jgi:hypothetical protein